MSDLGVTIVTGLALGVAYGVLGAAVSLVWVATRTLHLAIGSVLVVAVAVRLLLGVDVLVGASPAVAIAVAVALGAGLSAVLEPAVLAPLRRGVHWLVGLIVAGVVLDTLLARVLGARTYRPQPLLDLPAVEVAGTTVPSPVVVALVVGTPLVAGLAALVHATRFGRALRLVGGSEDAAALAGVSARWTRVQALALAGAAAALGGVLIAPIGTVGVTQSGSFTLRAVAAAAVFGVVGPARAVAGGLALGAVEALAQHAAPALPGDVAVGAFVIVVLVALGTPSRRAWGRAW